MSTPHPAKIAGLLLGCLLAPGVAAAEIPSAARLILGHPLDAEAGDDESPLAATTDDSAPPKSPWTVTLGAGLSYSQTDDVTLGANFNGTVVRDDDDSKWTTSLKYVYNFDENEVKDNFGIISTNELWYWRVHPMIWRPSLRFCSRTRNGQVLRAMKFRH